MTQAGTQAVTATATATVEDGDSINTGIQPMSSNSNSAAPMYEGYLGMVETILEIDRKQRKLYLNLESARNVLGSKVSPSTALYFQAHLLPCASAQDAATCASILKKNRLNPVPGP